MSLPVMSQQRLITRPCEKDRIETFKAKAWVTPLDHIDQPCIGIALLKQNEQQKGNQVQKEKSSSS